MLAPATTCDQRRRSSAKNWSCSAGVRPIPALPEGKGASHFNERALYVNTQGA